jgi:CrcB protein
MTVLQLLAVFVGGGAGAASRYLFGRFVGERYDGDFPLSTYLINVTGCFALGLLASLLSASTTANALLMALLGTGFLGGYTTFSTYALEGVLLYLDGSHRVAVLSLAGSVACGLLAAAAGAGVARLVIGA